MHLPLRLALAALVACLPLSAAAQTALPTVLNGNQIKTANATVIFDPTGAPLGTTANPIKTTCVSGCTVTSGGSVTISGTPSVAISGTPTVNLGTAPSLSISTLPALPTGSNTIGAVTISGTPNVALSGSLPGFASTPTVYDPNTASLVSAMSAPINAQTTHAVNIGGIEGITAAGSSGSYPVTVQGNAAGVPVPTTVGNVVTVTPATNSTGTVSQVQSDSSAAINVSTAATTTLVALASGKSIYVTAWDIVVAAADNVTLEYGTGTNCGTGTTALTGPYNLAANGGLTKGSGLGVLFKVPAGNALCIVTSAATQASGSVSYAQF
jgi:hypothetical protein